MKLFEIFKVGSSCGKVKGSSYILVLSCTSETAEKAAFTYVNQNVQKNVVRKKTVLADRIELTSEVILKNASTYFVNELLNINGVERATLLCEDA